MEQHTGTGRRCTDMTPLIPSLVLMGLVVVVALLAAALHWRARTPAT